MEKDQKQTNPEPENLEEVVPGEEEAPETAEEITGKIPDEVIAKATKEAEAVIGDEVIERVVKINRVSKVVKGGKNMSFNAIVVTGNGRGKVGMGLGKANEVSDAIIKGALHAKKSMKAVNLRGDTIPHEVIGKFKASNVLLKPAGPGTGVIAGGTVRALCDAVGIKNILTKCFGSRNPLNVAMAVLDGFGKLKLRRRG